MCSARATAHHATTARPRRITCPTGDRTSHQQPLAQLASYCPCAARAPAPTGPPAAPRPHPHAARPHCSHRQTPRHAPPAPRTQRPSSGPLPCQAPPPLRIASCAKPQHRFRSSAQVPPNIDRLQFQHASASLLPSSQLRQSFVQDRLKPAVTPAKAGILPPTSAGFVLTPHLYIFDTPFDILLFL
jgi:hypothetical protein